MKTNQSHKQIAVMEQKKKHFDKAIIKWAFPSQQYEHKTYWAEPDNTSWYVIFYVNHRKWKKNGFAASTAHFMDVITDGVTENANEKVWS